MQNNTTTIHGAGLGLRRSLMTPLTERPDQAADFLEVAPENWIGIGGQLGKAFRALTERYPFVLHGLSLSIGGPSPLDEAFIRQVKAFMETHDIKIYSEHLSYCSDGGHLYDLMPIPFSEEAVSYVAERIKRVQDILGQRIAIENISYYATTGQQMAEIDFINAVLDEADCDLLLDVNNVYVNAANHGYEPLAFIKALPGERISYLHVAGHYREADDLIVDTHGAEVVDPVWQLLDQTYQQFGVIPTLLERDFNIPPLEELEPERNRIHQLQLQQEHNHVRCA
ncbi:MAG: DUF692 domain-containing protein [Chromatiales bacterium]|nr:DUF692 domain-containing protein [Chromatiales bacterium]